MTKLPPIKLTDPWPRWVVFIVVFFCTIVAINVFFLYLAATTHGGLIEENPYEKGLAYQSVIDELTAWKNTGWKPKLKFSGANSKGIRTVILRLSDAEGNPVREIGITLTAKRADSEKADVVVELTETEEREGVYEGVAKLERPGLWLATLRGVQDGKSLRWETREVLP